MVKTVFPSGTMYVKARTPDPGGDALGATLERLPGQERALVVALRV